MGSSRSRHHHVLGRKGDGLSPLPFGPLPAGITPLLFSTYSINMHYIWHIWVHFSLQTPTRKKNCPSSLSLPTVPPGLASSPESAVGLLPLLVGLSPLVVDTHIKTRISSSLSYVHGHETPLHTPLLLPLMAPSFLPCPPPPSSLPSMHPPKTTYLPPLLAPSSAWTRLLLPELPCVASVLLPGLLERPPSCVLAVCWARLVVVAMSCGWRPLTSRCCCGLWPSTCMWMLGRCLMVVGWGTIPRGQSLLPRGGLLPKFEHRKFLRWADVRGSPCTRSPCQNPWEGARYVARARAPGTQRVGWSSPGEPR